MSFFFKYVVGQEKNSREATAICTVLCNSNRPITTGSVAKEQRRRLQSLKKKELVSLALG